MSEQQYKVGDQVRSNSKWSKGRTGVIWKISEYCVHVRFGEGDNAMFEKYHFRATHHMQSAIDQIEKVTTEY